MFWRLSTNELVREFSGNGILVVYVFGVSQPVSGADVFACQFLFVLEVVLSPMLTVNEA